MSYHLDLGKKAEKMVADYLTSKGYVLLERNWRWKKAEIDIIAMDDKELVFIEVKARSDYNHGYPELAVSPRKRILMLDAATRYMEQIQHEWAIRFDVVSVVVQNEKMMQLDHYEDSFSPWE
jgi:putative endonuclease